VFLFFFIVQFCYKYVCTFSPVQYVIFYSECFTVNKSSDTVEWATARTSGL